MTKKKRKMKQPQNPNSRKNLTGEGRFADIPGAAAEAGRKSGIVRKQRAEVERLLNENLDEALTLLDADMTREDFMKVASNGRNQMQRILAREFSDPSTAFDAIGWAFDRVLGRSLQQIRQQQSVEVKPRHKRRNTYSATSISRCSRRRRHATFLSRAAAAVASRMLCLLRRHARHTMTASTFCTRASR